MTRILRVSSGRATPNTERRACATQGFSGATNIEANGARAAPSNEMLAAPSRNAVHTLAGGPGRSSAAITSHKISSAGATAAVPITVGSASRRFIGAANRPRFSVIYGSKCAGTRVLPHAQQPLQIFFSRAFISASSAPIESTNFAVSAFDAGAVFGAGFAAVVAAAGGTTLS